MNASAYQRMLLKLLPPSRWWKGIGVVQKALLAAADELARVDARVRDLLEEADPRTANELLADYELELGLTASGTPSERRARIVALYIRRARFRPQDFLDVLAPLLGADAADLEVIERTAAEAAAMGDPREIFRFFIYRNPALPGSYDRAAAQSMVNKMKPSHTNGHVITSVGFLCDDPSSLCDTDILGV